MTAHWWGPARVWNTASNLAFPMVGVGVAIWRSSGSAWGFAATMLTLGAGSGAYHWWGTPTTRRLDWFGMYCVLTGLAVLAASPHDPLIHWWMLGLAVGIPALLVYAFRQVGADAVIGLGLGLVALPILATGGASFWLALASLGCFGIAKAFHWADLYGKAWVGAMGHTVWHGLAAVAFGLMALAGGV